MFRLDIIFVCLSFGLIACLFKTTDGRFYCDLLSHRSTRNFIKEGCPQIGTADCLNNFAKCITDNQIELFSAIGTCTSYFPKTNMTDFQTLLCHVCEDTTNSPGETPDGFDIMCCVKKYELKGTGIWVRQRDRIGTECLKTLDPSSCKATQERKDICKAL